MGRLIDADKLKADLEKAISKNEDMDCLDFLRIASVIDKQPTAYDPDKVVEQLEEIKTGANTNCKRDCSDYDWSTGACQGLCEEYLKKRAIEIVKAGGADAEH
nr:MAG TPA: hypothetical protein [Caudoviricetes sp.]